MDASVLDRTQKEFVEALKVAFKLLDNKGKQHIAPERLADIDEDHEVQEYTEGEVKDYIHEFKKFDADGGVDFEEFFGLMKEAVQDEKVLKKGLKISFQAFDRRKKELLDKEDFRAMMESLGEKLTDEELNDMMKRACQINDLEIGPEDFEAQTELLLLNKFMKL